MAARALLFDLDGTIWRGHEWYAFILREVGGIDETVTIRRLAAGENVFYLARRAGVSRQRLISACRTRVESLTVYDGVQRGLSQLAEAEYKLGVVTSLSKWIAGPALRILGLEEFFGTKKFAAKKSGPLPLLTALADLGETADARHYYIGDTSTDAKCAFLAGVSFAWASYGYGKVETSSQIKVLRKFSDVVSL